MLPPQGVSAKPLRRRYKYVDHILLEGHFLTAGTLPSFAAAAVVTSTVLRPILE